MSDPNQPAMFPRLPGIPAPRRIPHRRTRTSNGDWLLISRQRGGLDRAVWRHDPSGHGGRGREGHMSQIHARIEGENASRQDAIPPEAEEEVEVQPYGELHPMGPLHKTFERQLIEELPTVLVDIGLQTRRTLFSRVLYLSALGSLLSIVAQRSVISVPAIISIFYFGHSFRPCCCSDSHTFDLVFLFL
jgi:hypothetical protein